MLNQIKCPEIDDFWSDCIKFEIPKKTKKKKRVAHPQTRTLLKSASCKNFLLNTEKDNFYNHLKFLKNHKFLQKMAFLEMDQNISRENHRKKQIETLSSIYERSVINHRKNQRELNKLRENKTKSESKNISKNKYKHNRINRSYDISYKKIFGEKNIYERDKIYKKNHEQKMAGLKREIMFVNEMDDFPYKPNIQAKDLNRVLYGKNIWEKKANNFSNKMFLWRYTKARNNKKNLSGKKDITRDVTKVKSRQNLQNHSMYRSISLKDSLLYKKSLHNSLMSFKSNDNNNNNDDEGGDNNLK